MCIANTVVAIAAIALVFACCQLSTELREPFPQRSRCQGLPCGGELAGSISPLFNVLTVLKKLSVARMHKPVVSFTQFAALCFLDMISNFVERVRSGCTRLYGRTHAAPVQAPACCPSLSSMVAAARRGSLRDIYWAPSVLNAHSPSRMPMSGCSNSFCVNPTPRR